MIFVRALGGQLWMFAIGVGHYVFENYDIESIKFLASSSGCFAAVPLACGFDPYEWCKVMLVLLSLLSFLRTAFLLNISLACV
jgi:hypothetical protein